MKLPSTFFERDTLKVAQALLGMYLVRETPDGRRVCRITETEAYIGRSDKACHAYGYKRTKRTETLYADAGTIYIYLIYGMHHCLNFVTEAQGEPAAVLLRAAVPIVGAEAMSQARFGKCLAAQQKNFLNGPGKLCAALSLTRSENAQPLGTSLWLSDDATDFGLANTKLPPMHIGKRVGIDYAEEAKDFPGGFGWSFRRRLFQRI